MEEVQVNLVLKIPLSKKFHLNIILVIVMKNLQLKINVKRNYQKSYKKCLLIK